MQKKNKRLQSVIIFTVFFCFSSEIARKSKRYRENTETKSFVWIFDGKEKIEFKKKKSKQE
jgi:hypothetical protein